MIFSVIITSCNYLAYVDEAVCSVLTAGGGDIEIIVYDDASEDGSYSHLVTVYAGNKNVQVISSMVRRGQAKSLNEAFNYVSGDYILFLDADDTFSPCKLKAIKDFVSIRPDIGFIQHDLLEIDESGISCGTRFGAGSLATGCKLYSGDILTRILDPDSPYSWFFAPTSGLCLRRDFAEKIFPLPCEFRICADVPIAYGAALLGEVGLIEEPLGCYRLHSKSGYASQLKSSAPGWASEQFINILERYSLLLDMKKTGRFHALVNRNLPKLQHYERYWEFYYRVVHPSMGFSAIKLLSLRFSKFREGGVDFWYLVSKHFDDLVFILSARERRQYQKAFYSRFHRLSWTARMLLGAH